MVHSVHQMHSDRRIIELPVPVIYGRRLMSIKMKVIKYMAIMRRKAISTMVLKPVVDQSGWITGHTY